MTYLLIGIKFMKNEELYGCLIVFVVFVISVIYFLAIVWEPKDCMHNMRMRNVEICIDCQICMDCKEKIKCDRLGH